MAQTSFPQEWSSLLLLTLQQHLESSSHIPTDLTTRDRRSIYRQLIYTHIANVIFMMKYVFKQSLKYIKNVSEMLYSIS